MNSLRILDYAWHQVHSYRLHALPVKFTYLNVRRVLWNVAQRPIPSNFMGGIGPDEVRGEDFDAAFLHLDQWCDRYNIRALPYRISKIIAQREGIPAVVIMHGTPDSPKNRERILQMIGDLPVVCNSFDAAVAWDNSENRVNRYGFPQFSWIIHGYNASEFWSNEQREGIVTVCSGGKLSREYHGIPLLERLMRDVPITWYGPRGTHDWLSSYDEYRDMLASALVYFSPTRDAPMPGARTEAMLSGCCVVTVPGNDIEGYIEHGRTGFIVYSYAEARDVLLELLHNPGSAKRIGESGRRAAQRIFHNDRFINDWMQVLTNIGVVEREDKEFHREDDEL